MVSKNVKFKSVWHEGYYYVLGAGQTPRYRRVVAWVLLPLSLFAILLGSILSCGMERLNDPRKAGNE